MTVKIGTSGWQYRDWRSTFYPKDLPTSRWLDFYATCFDTVEVNNAFYRLPSAEVFERWRESTPEELRDGGEGEQLPDAQQAPA